MELDGNEKRIQVLYSELSFENQNTLPQFERLWTAAAVIDGAEVRGPGMPKALLIAAAVIALACSFAVWSWYRFTASPPPNIVKHLPQPAVVESPAKPKVLSVSERVKAQPRRQKNTARRRDIDRWATKEAAMLSSWQSPTSRFMESPTSLVLSSLPQLNQSAKDLESFLPRNNEIMKESK